MSRKFISALSAAALLFATPMASFGETPALPAAAPAQPSARALQLAKRYVAAIHMDRSYVALMGPMSKMMMDQFQADGLPITPEFSKAMQESMVESGDIIVQQMIERLTPEIARIYTEDELQAMVDFFESPVGQAILAKTGQVTQASAKFMPELMPAYKAELQKRLCAKINCDTGPYMQLKPTST